MRVRCAEYSGNAMGYSIIDCTMISLICGAAFGIVYEALRITRRVLPFTAVTFICDILFFIAAAFAVLKLSLYLGNYVRAYTILGFGFGVFAYIQTVGRLISAAERGIILLIKNTVGRLILKIAHLTARIIGAFAHNIAKRFGKIYDFFVMRKKNAVSLLQKQHEKMYNSKRNIALSAEVKSNGEIVGGKNVIHAKVNRS